MNLRREVSNALVGRGFRRRDRIHLLRIDASFSLGVDTGPLGKRSDIAPFVGIRHDGVETLLSELLDLAPDDWVGTVAANVGYVLGKGYQRWEPPTQAEHVLEAIEIALDRLRPLLSLEKLPEAWSIEGARGPLWRYREIIVLLTRGQVADSLMRLEAARAELCRHEDEVCDQFLSFAERLQTLVEQRA